MEAALQHRKLTLVLYDDPERVRYGWGGKKLKESICVLITSSHCCTEETNNIAKELSLQLKINLKKQKAKKVTTRKC